MGAIKKNRKEEKNYNYYLIMSKSLLYTEDPFQALHIRGYTFKAANYGFDFGTKAKANRYGVGPMGSIFMNDLMERSSLEGAATFRFMFGKKRYAAGDISACYPSIAEDMFDKGKSFAEADQKAQMLFLSDELSKYGMKMPCLYEVPYVNAGDILVKHEGKDGKVNLKVKGDDKPFYYLVNLASPENPKGEIPNDWRAMLTMWQYSWHHDAVGMRIAISNTKSAYYGLPPNSTALRMPLLRTEIIPELCSSAVGKKQTSKSKGKKAEKKKPAETPKEKKKPKPSEPKQAPSASKKKDPATWKPKLELFLDQPTELNHKSLLDDRTAWKQFCSEGPDLLGKSKYMVKRLRKPYIGIDNAAEGKVLIDMIRECWTEDNQILTVLFKWSTLTKWEQGKFYFHLEEKAKATAGPSKGPAKEADTAPGYQLIASVLSPEGSKKE